MNPITSSVAASCSRLATPRGSLTPRLSPHSSPWHSPVMAYKFGQNLALPKHESSGGSGRRGSHDKRDLFAYNDTTTKKHAKDDQGKTTKSDGKTATHATASKQTSTTATGPRKKRLKDIAIEVKHNDDTKRTKLPSEAGAKRTKKSKKCVLM